jgi:hypothetical protein
MRRWPDLTFAVKMRVKRRYGRFHRAILLSSNEVKSSFLKPSFDVRFDLKPDPEWIAQFVARGLSDLRSPVPPSIEKAGANAAGAVTEHHNFWVARNPKEHIHVMAGSPEWLDADFEAGDDGVDSSTAGGEYYDPADGTKWRGRIVVQGAVPRREDLDDMLDKRGTFRVDAPPRDPPLMYRFPLGETEDISAVLHEVKEKVGMLQTQHAFSHPAASYAAAQHVPAPIDESKELTRYFAECRQFFPPTRRQPFN